VGKREGNNNRGTTPNGLKTSQEKKKKKKGKLAFNFNMGGRKPRTLIAVGTSGPGSPGKRGNLEGKEKEGKLRSSLNNRMLGRKRRIKEVQRVTITRLWEKKRWAKLRGRGRKVSGRGEIERSHGPAKCPAKRKKEVYVQMLFSVSSAKRTPFSEKGRSEL